MKYRVYLKSGRDGGYNVAGVLNEYDTKQVDEGTTETRNGDAYCSDTGQRFIPDGLSYEGTPLELWFKAIELYWDGLHAHTNQKIDCGFALLEWAKFKLNQ